MHPKRGRKRSRSAALLVGAALGSTVLVLGLAASGASATTYKPVYQYAQYVGGSGTANPKLSPIVVGVVNEQGGPASPAPEWSIGATIAAKYMNQHTGGIDGHPVEIKTCWIPDTVSSAATCGQEFADDSAVSVIASGGIAVGNQAMESALAPTKKPIVFGVSLSTVDTVYPYGYILYGDATHVEAPIATFAVKYLHVKTVSIIWPTVPGEQVSADIIVSALKYLGIKSSDIYDVSFDPSETDLTVPLEASHAGSTSLLMTLNSGGPACSDTYLALKELAITTKVLANVPCATPLIAKADGGQLPVGWYYASANPMPGNATDPSLAAFQKVATEYGEASYGPDAWVADAFGQMVTIGRWGTELLKAGKQITPATMNAMAKAFKGPVVQGAPNLNCGGFPGSPAVCNDEVSFFQNTAPGVMKPVVYYIGPPAGFNVAKAAAAG